jgi:2-phospho-L-lactate guanylyltransferase
MRLDSPATRPARPAPSLPSGNAAGVRATSSVAAVVVPIRAFSDGGARLAGALDPGARADLARRMADVVLAAAGSLPVAVVTSAPEVVAWARGHGAQVVGDPGGLDAAVAAGVEWCARTGHVRAIVAHADLPRAPIGSLERFAADAGREVVTVVPCHRDDGSPVLTVPTHRPFPFAYGSASFRRHAARASRLGLGIKVVRDPDLAFDLDLPEDLARLGPDLGR